MADKERQSVFDIEPDEAEEARLDAEVMAACAKFVERLKSWSKPNELPCPKPE